MKLLLKLQYTDIFGLVTHEILGRAHAIRPQGCKNIMLNSAEQEIIPTHICENCWHFNIYMQDIYFVLGLSEPEKY